MIFIEKDDIYPIVKEIYDVRRKKVQSSSTISIEKNEEVSLFEYEKANLGYTGVYESKNH